MTDVVAAVDVFPASIADFSVADGCGESEDGVDGNWVILNFLIERPRSKWVAT